MCQRKKQLKSECQQMKNPAQSKNASRHLMDKCQLKKNEANFCSILEACSHPKLLNEVVTSEKRNKNCNETEFLQYPVFFISSITAT